MNDIWYKTKTERIMEIIIHIIVTGLIIGLSYFFHEKEIGIEIHIGILITSIIVFTYISIYKHYKNIKEYPYMYFNDNDEPVSNTENIIERYYQNFLVHAGGIIPILSMIGSIYVCSLTWLWPTWYTVLFAVISLAGSNSCIVICDNIIFRRNMEKLYEDY